MKTRGKGSWEGLFYDIEFIHGIVEDPLGLNCGIKVGGTMMEGHV